MLDGFGYQIGGAAHGHQIGALVVFDGFDGDRAAFGFADHGNQAGLLQHHAGEFVHAGGGGGAGGAHHFIAHGIDGADVVNHAVGEVHGQLLTLGQHVVNAFVGGIAAGEHFAVQEQGLAGLPAGDFFLGQGVQIDALAGFGVGCPFHLGPQIEAGRFQVNGAAAVHHKVGVARGCAVGDHGHGFAGRVRGVELDFYVQHGREAAQALCPNAQGIDFFVQLQAQLFDLVEFFAAFGLGLQLVHVQVFHQAFFGQQHGFFGCAAHTNAQHARRTPARAHFRHGFEHPVHQVVAGVHHDDFGLVLAAAAFGRDGDIQLVARDDLHVDDGGGVVLGVFAGKQRVGHNRGPQGVVRVQVAPAHAFVDGVFQALVSGETFKTHVHADFQEDVHDAGVLANRAVAKGGHFGVGQNLRHGIFGGSALLALIGTGQVLDVVGRVVVADVLQGSCNRFNQVLVANGGSHRLSTVKESAVRGRVSRDYRAKTPTPS